MSSYIFNRFMSRSMFTFIPKCDTLLNNICEGFNSVFVVARAKPIINMLEDIKIYIMQRWENNILNFVSFQGSNCPKFLRKVQQETHQTRYLIPMLNQNTHTNF